MSRDTSRDPICAHCGQRLRPHHYHSVELPTGEPYQGNLVVISRKPSGVKPGFDHVALWDGEQFGYRGRGTFCSLTCGYRWAMKRARALS